MDYGHKFSVKEEWPKCQCIPWLFYMHWRADKDEFIASVGCVG